MKNKVTSAMQAVGALLITVGVAWFSVPVGLMVLGAALIIIGGLA